MTAIPVSPDFFVIEYDSDERDFVRYPVIAWKLTSEGVVPIVIAIPQPSSL
jgi:hypothetical protein